MLEKQELLSRWRDIMRALEGTPASLLAVSKYATDAAVDCLAAAGQLDFAESRPQALRDRASRFQGLCWHVIGPVQKNKAKYVGRFATMWHSVEDSQTALAVARHVVGRRLPVLLQVQTGNIAHQHGISPERLSELYEQVQAIPELEITGLMTMAPKGGDTRAAFCTLRRLRDGLGNGSLRHLSMGMSGDWRIALEEGATMVRLGSLLFGNQRAA